MASKIFPSCGFVGPWRPLVREEQFLQGAEEFEQAREGHGCLSSHRVDEPFDPAVGRPVDLVEEGSVRNPFIRAGIERSAETVYGS